MKMVNDVDVVVLLLLLLCGCWSVFLMLGDSIGLSLGTTKWSREGEKIAVLDER